MIADTSDIHRFSVAQRRHADDLTSVAADLAAATAAADAFGAVGAPFVAALNRALALEARHATHLAARLAAARSVANGAANSYRATEDAANHGLSLLSS